MGGVAIWGVWIWGPSRQCGDDMGMTGTTWGQREQRGQHGGGDNRDNGDNDNGDNGDNRDHMGPSGGYGDYVGTTKSLKIAP